MRGALMTRASLDPLVTAAVQHHLGEAVRLAAPNHTKRIMS
jgi:hypothetical protein